MHDKSNSCLYPFTDISRAMPGSAETKMIGKNWERKNGSSDSDVCSSRKQETGSDDDISRSSTLTAAYTSLHIASFRNHLPAYHPGSALQTVFQIDLVKKAMGKFPEDIQINIWLSYISAYDRFHNVFMDLPENAYMFEVYHTDFLEKLHVITDEITRLIASRSDDKEITTDVMFDSCEVAWGDAAMDIFYRPPEVTTEAGKLMRVHPAAVPIVLTMLRRDGAKDLFRGDGYVNLDFATI